MCNMAANILAKSFFVWLLFLLLFFILFLQLDVVFSVQNDICDVCFHIFLLKEESFSVLILNLS